VPTKLVAKKETTKETQAFNGVGIGRRPSQAPQSRSRE
jgi:hypothetical protein